MVFKKRPSQSFKKPPKLRVFRPTILRPRRMSPKLKLLDFSTAGHATNFMRKLFRYKKVYYDPRKDPLGYEKIWMRPEIRPAIEGAIERYMTQGYEKYHREIIESIRQFDLNPLKMRLQSEHVPDAERQAKIIFGQIANRSKVFQPIGLELRKMASSAAVKERTDLKTFE